MKDKIATDGEWVTGEGPPTMSEDLGYTVSSISELEGAEGEAESQQGAAASEPLPSLLGTSAAPGQLPQSDGSLKLQHAQQGGPSRLLRGGGALYKFVLVVLLAAVAAAAASAGLGLRRGELSPPAAEQKPLVEFPPSPLPESREEAGGFALSVQQQETAEEEEEAGGPPAKPEDEVEPWIDTEAPTRELEPEDEEEELSGLSGPFSDVEPFTPAFERRIIDTFEDLFIFHPPAAVSSEFLKDAVFALALFRQFTSQSRQLLAEANLDIPSGRRQRQWTLCKMQLAYYSAAEAVAVKRIAELSAAPESGRDPDDLAETKALLKDIYADKVTLAALWKRKALQTGLHPEQNKNEFVVRMFTCQEAHYSRALRMLDGEDEKLVRMDDGFAFPEVEYKLFSSMRPSRYDMRSLFLSPFCGFCVV
ncbi:hypothetical protein Efla_001160 [Eimeria flavescens]